MTRSRIAAPNLLLLVSASLFLVFDAAVLGVGYWIARQVAEDAVTINLAGRQRMLTQRITKDLLHLQLESDRSVTVGVETDLRDATHLFDSTLRAFATGGMAIGGDGSQIQQRAIRPDEGLELVSQSLVVWQPLRQRLVDGLNLAQEQRTAYLKAIAPLALDSGDVLMQLANQLTSRVEEASRYRTEKLRLLQVFAFVLALTNFAVMMHTMWRRMRGLHLRQQQMQRLALQDPLTQLPNRSALTQHLKEALESLSCGECSGFVVGFVDLNDFKPINDEFGHAAGDRVLSEVASRLRTHLRHSDMVARFGGDEFVVVLHEVQQAEDAIHVLDVLSDVVRRPLRMGDRDLKISFSLGAVHVDDASVDVDRLLMHADKTMYRAKYATKQDWLLVRLAHGDEGLVEVGGAC